MNCKPGDLVLIIRAKTQHQHIGKIVMCVRPYTENAWITEPELKSKTTGRAVAWFDAHLRPIRNDPGQDETLDWLPVPTIHKETA